MKAISKPSADKAKKLEKLDSDSIEKSIKEDLVIIRSRTSSVSSQSDSVAGPGRKPFPRQEAFEIATPRGASVESQEDL